MHVKRPLWISKNGRAYQSAWLCKSRRVGSRTVTEYVLNLKDWAEEEVEALDFALKQGPAIHAMVPLEGLKCIQGKSIGAVWALREVARRLGLDRALGEETQGRLALWQLLACLLMQKTRLPVAALHKTHALAEALSIYPNFNDHALIDNLTWLAEKQGAVEDYLFQLRRKIAPTDLFFYDVTAACLAALPTDPAAHPGTLGLFCDARGMPVSTRICQGGCHDLDNFSRQIRDVTNRFGCRSATLVGAGEIFNTVGPETLHEAGMGYIRGLTRTQIKELLSANRLSTDMFGEQSCEASLNGQRYLLWRDLTHAKERTADRMARLRRLTTWFEEQKQRTGLGSADGLRQRVMEKIHKLKLNACVEVRVNKQTLLIEVNEAALANASALDGCHVLRMDCSRYPLDVETAVARYQDMVQIEQMLRAFNVAWFGLRVDAAPGEDTVQGQLLLIMLAYLIHRELARSWKPLNHTVETGIESLETLCYHELRATTGAVVRVLPQSGALNRKLFKALKISEPPTVMTKI